MNIEERLTKLEKQNKKLRYMNTISLVLVGMFLITGFQQQFQLPDIIKAKGFILLDDNNKERAVLKIDTTEKRNSPKLRFYDEKNDIITSIGTNVDEGYLSLKAIEKLEYSDNHDTISNWITANGFRIERNSVESLFLGLGRYNKPLIKLIYIDDFNDDTTTNQISISSYSIFNNSKNKYYAGLTYNKSSAIVTTLLSLAESGSYELALANSSFNEYPKFEMRFNNENIKSNSTYVRYNIGINENGNFYNNIYDNYENRRFSQYIFDYNGNEKITSNFYDIYGNLRLSLGNKELRNSNGYEYITPESSINLFNENGNVIEQLPR